MGYCGKLARVRESEGKTEGLAGEGEECMQNDVATALHSSTSFRKKHLNANSIQLDVARIHLCNYCHFFCYCL